jgi:Ima1 N-terminal domain
MRCFYCGRRSAQSGADPIRKWQCKYCDAVNYLDEVRYLITVSCLSYFLDPFDALLKHDADIPWFIRKEKSQIPRPMRPTQKRMAWAQPVNLLNRLISPTPACFAEYASEINIFS